MKKFAEGLGRLVLTVVSILLFMIPRFAFDVVCPWNSRHPILWQIPATTLVVLYIVGGVTSIFFFLIKDSD